MSESGGSSWVDGSGQTWAGTPPPDWWQASDGRWFPPTVLSVQTPPDGTPRPPVPPLGDGSTVGRAVDAYKAWPLWARVAAPVTAAFAVLIGVGALAGEEPTSVKTDDPAAVVPHTTPTTAPPRTTVATTAPPPPPTTAAPPPPTTAAPPPPTQPPPTSPPAAPPPAPPPPSDVYYENCTAAWAAGAAPVYAGDPGYRAGLDRDGDGVGCEQPP
jgi:hypothetical protein